MATAALDFGTASEMLGPGEPAARGDKKKKKRGRACVSECVHVCESGGKGKQGSDQKRGRTLRLCLSGSAAVDSKQPCLQRRTKES